MDKVKWLKGIISGLKDSIEEYEATAEINPDVANEIVAGTNVLITYIEELERLVEKVSHFENMADELQEELIEKDEKIEQLEQYKKVLMENSVVRSETIERYEKALKEITESNEDTSCNEIALKYEVIADKALND